VSSLIWGFSGSCLSLLPRLTFTPNLSSIFPSLRCFIKQFLWKIWPNISPSCYLCKINQSFLTLHNTPFLTRLLQVFISIFLQNFILYFPRIYDQIYEVPKLQHHFKLCSKCGILLGSSLTGQCRRHKVYCCAQNTNTFRINSGWRDWISDSLNKKQKL